MNKDLRFSSPAANELGAAAAWYEEQAKGLGSEFLRSVEISLASIRRSPLLFPIVIEENQIRRCILKKFPFGVFFSIENDCILIISIFHSKRNPEKLKKNYQR